MRKLPSQPICLHFSPTPYTAGFYHHGAGCAFEGIGLPADFCTQRGVFFLVHGLQAVELFILPRSFGFLPRRNGLRCGLMGLLPTAHQVLDLMPFSISAASSVDFI
ncbi:MAG: hypothetical protein EOO38_06760 [Cytophagaceae bacterium]|nr:MAG: hypothetical protein EOO38_06760 [Cytophagaceae bacterium]